MTPIERQILINQRDIMIKLHDGEKPFYEGFFAYRIEETDKLLNSKKKSRKEQVKEFTDDLIPTKEDDERWEGRQI